MKKIDDMIEEFCGYCDFKDEYGPCKEGFGILTTNHDQKRYVERDWCGWSNVQGVPMYNVTKDYWQIRSKVHPHPFQRSGVETFLKAIEKEKELGNTQYDAEVRFKKD